jgi:hypothetical protein
MSSVVARVSLSLLLFGTVLAAQGVSPNGPAISPFRGMRAVADGIEVQVADDTWYALEAVAGVPTATLLREAERLCGAAAWKRITEDLPALLDAMGTKVGVDVAVTVRDLTTQRQTKLEAVTMTAENRRRLWSVNNGRPVAESTASPFGREAVRADLQALRTLLDEQFAYRQLRPVDLDALLRDAERRLGEGPVDGTALAREVDRVLRAFGDGHSRVDATHAAPSAYPPFLVQGVEGGHVAFLPDRSAFLSPEHPFVDAIDGVPLATWLAAARARATQGGDTMQARDTERGLRELVSLRAELQLPPQPRATIALRGAAGTKEVTVDLVRRRPTYGAWPRTATRRLDGDLGYLRVEDMRGDDEFLASLDVAMQSFRDTKGIVIDVRGNGGGTRDALRRLAPYFMPANGAPVVGNVAAALLRRGEIPGHDLLADRGLFPLDWPDWTDAQRTAITTFLRGFEPSWRLPAGKFSPWHVLVLDRADNPKAFAYAGKVVVLIDRGCFSATDVFAAALGALPSVTLVGEPTSGGSGRARGHRLPNSQVRLQLSTMASFRPDGVLFEGNGVVPDVVVATRPGDLIGTSDTALAKAIELLR